MLIVTPAATAAVTAILEEHGLPDGAGLRLQSGVDAAGKQAIGLAVVSEPGPNDEHVSAAPDDNVFLAHDLVDLLDDQVLDAEIDGQDIAFRIRPQSVDGRLN